MGNRISYRDVLRHSANGRSPQEIAAACFCSRSAVQDILARADERGVGWDDVAALTDDEARRLVRGNPGAGKTAFAAIDMQRIDDELARDRTMTLSVLWEEYYASAVARDERPYLYSRFCELYAEHKSDLGVKGRKAHVPGDLGEFDYAGKTMGVADELTGELTTAYLFVACLPFSQMTYVRADPSMDIDHWVEQSMLAFEFFGGVPRILTIDNLKVGVTKHANDEIVINRTFREFAEHYNIAVIPHAVGRPTGKGSVESNVDKIANRIRNMLRERVFFSFEDLNAAIQELLAELNARPFQKREGSRESVFAEKEASAPAEAAPRALRHRALGPQGHGPGRLPPAMRGGPRLLFRPLGIRGSHRRGEDHHAGRGGLRGREAGGVARQGPLASQGLARDRPGPSPPEPRRVGEPRQRLVPPEGRRGGARVRPGGERVP